MDKKVVFSSGMMVFGLILLIGSTRFLPDLKPIGTAVSIVILGAVILLARVFNKEWNTKMYIGAALIFVGIIGISGAAGYLPRYAPIITMGVAAIAGAVLLTLGVKKSVPGKGFGIKSNPVDTIGYISAAALFIISIVLLPQIEWSHPKDPAGVMILSFLSGIALVYALVKNHKAKKQVVIAGAIEAVNFMLIPAYERGFLDFIGGFYRLFTPVYSLFDRYASAIEYILIAVTVILVAVFAVKKVKVSDYGNTSLYYFILQPVMAIFLFEMMGLPAGFLAGATTRSDLLVTNTNAVMSTFGIIFIAALMYMAFQLFPFWATPLLAGAWWVFWKPWLLHHPDPAMFTDFRTFLPAGLFLFFTGLKRIALPMILLIGISMLRKKPKKRRSTF